MIQIRRSDERGHAKLDWLDSRFTFSFADYFDPEHVQFRSLRVINEDHVAPGQGFGMHPHRDMEIITYILDGAIEHRDNMGNRGVIRPGEVQKMSAGTGVMHSEFNPSKTQPITKESSPATSSTPSLPAKSRANSSPSPERTALSRSTRTPNSSPRSSSPAKRLGTRSRKDATPGFKSRAAQAS